MLGLDSQDGRGVLRRVHSSERSPSNSGSLEPNSAGRHPQASLKWAYCGASSRQANQMCPGTRKFPSNTHREARAGEASVTSIVQLRGSR